MSPRRTWYPMTYSPYLAPTRFVSVPGTGLSPRRTWYPMTYSPYLVPKEESRVPDTTNNTNKKRLPSQQAASSYINYDHLANNTP
ncbi:hypothetical protein, partial [Halobacillus sp. BBL2006]|uniref:hypothetical protein n=1 Tax=Halobacillus sp. BBL2006 TaxID=1543706 RepID=UPI001E63FBAA